MRLTESDISIIVDDYRTGVSVPCIAEKVGCSESSVWFYVRGIICEKKNSAYVDMRDRCLGLSDFELGWVSGIIDGEGWVGIGRNKTFLGARISVSSADNIMVPRLNMLLGGNVCKKKAHEKCRSQKTWDLYTLSTVRAFCEVVGVKLHVKKRQAELLADFCRMRMEFYSKKYTHAELLIVDKLSVLNKKGV